MQTRATMARPLWSGSISFGLVQIPVGVLPAEIAAESLSFTLLDKRDRSPIGYRQVNKNTGEEVPKEQRVKGYQIAKGEYVLIDDDDFRRANVKATETIDIHAFVERSSIPLLRFEKPYYLAPEKQGLKGYALLREALDHTGKAAVATMVMRGRQHLCAVMPYQGALVLELLRYDHEIAEPEPVDLPKVTPAEVRMAETLIEGMTTKGFDTHQIKDSYHDDLLKLIKERHAHPDAKLTSAPKTQSKPSGADDIMKLLKASVEKHQAAANTDEERPLQRRRTAHRRAPSSTRRGKQRG